MALSVTIVSSLLLLAYLFGSFPSGYLLGRYLKGIDIRSYGSGSIGATNVLRTLGKKAAIAALILDLLKGVLAVANVYFLYRLLPPATISSHWQPWLITATALAAIVGHTKSVWINFDGGKAVATSLGVLLVMNPVVACGAAAVFGLVVAISRIVSLSSMAAAIAVNLLMIALGQPLPYLLFGGVAGIYVIWRHRSNLERLLAGTEPRIGQSAPQQEV